MFYHDGGKLQYKVEVETPNPVFAKMLQQAIGGIEGEMRVALQYLFQAWNSRGPKRYRDMLLETGTEELAHIEMLATAVALNLEGADGALKEEMAKANPVGGQQRQHRRRHDLERERRGDRTRPRHAALRVHRRPRHEGYAVVFDRARHHAPAAVARGHRGVGRV